MPNQNRPLLIGVTGGIGSGKSTICKVFQCLGVPVYDADTRARWLMNNDKQLVQKITAEFGDNSYLDGELNRVYLAKEVFSNPEKLATLNSLTHPSVRLDFENWVEKHSDFNYLVKEAALLVESGTYKQLDKLILVSAPEKVRVQRVLKRDLHRTKEDVLRIIRQQMPESDKANFCDYVVTNDDKISVLGQIFTLHKSFS